METGELEKALNCEDVTQLSRNRSFKSKQLVRSQAIRESQSPPRTHSPAQHGVTPEPVDRTVTGAVNASDNSSHSDLSSDAISPSDVKISDSDDYKKKQQVEIQITSGAWEPEARGELGVGGDAHALAEPARDLLSYSPRVYCVCGACANCPHCKGRRRKRQCPTKQDSGIACSDDCPDCSDSEQTGNASSNDLRKSGSFDVEDQSYYCRCPERKDRPKNISLCKNESDERFEPTGPELVAFIKETLNKNARDRFALLKIEKELNALVNDTGRCVVKFPVMTSYGRMLVHRCASLFQLSHHLDQMNKTAVLVSKNGTSGGRIPCTNFKEWCVGSFPPSPQRHQSDGHKSILKRDTHSLDETGSGVLSSNRSKSLEQREKEYERVRRRIFSTDNCSQQDEQWPWLNSGPVKLLTSEAGRNKLLKVQSLESSGSGAASGSGSGSNTNWRARGAVSKSHSFGGYANTHPPAQPQQHRLLSRQGDLASSSWRLSPSSSGYKTLSLRSTDSITPSPTGGASPEPSVCGGATREGVVWCVTDMAAVPPGALVIHPQTGRPLTNPDGSVYHFDPANPPVIYDPGASDNEQQKDAIADPGVSHSDPVDPPAEYDSAAPTKDPPNIDQSNEKKRGRLEKQHSFNDNDCECEPSAESHSKCCCVCRRDDGAQKKTTSEKETNTKSPSPNNFYETNAHASHTNVQTSLAQNVPTGHAQIIPTGVTQNVPTSHAQNLPTSHVENVPTGHALDVPTSHVQETTNHKPPYDQTTNNEPPTETTLRQYETPANQRHAYDNQNTNQKIEPQNSLEMTNHRQGNDVMANNGTKLANQDSQELQQYAQTYAQAYRTDELCYQVATPPQMNHYVQADGSVQAMVPQAKVAPIPIQDPNIRPVSITNMVYPTAVPPGYPYQCRVDQQLQPVYQTLVQAQDEPKQLAPSPHAPDNTFRIDPSYPYAAIDYTAAACGACVDTTALQHQQRSYSVPYGQVEMPSGVLPPYQVSNVLLPQQHMQQYPYQEPMPWSGAGPKLMVPEVYPFVQYPQPHYPHYNIMYPQVIPQPYPVCQPMYPYVEKQPEPQRRNSTVGIRPSKQNSVSGSARNTPSQEEKVPYDEKNTDIAAKIQQIKSQMAQLNTRDKDRPRREEWRRGDANGNGLLGNYPLNNYHGRPVGRSSNDESQLTSAARAIVNSIRNMQAKNTYQDARRPERYDGYKDRPERRRPEREDERPERPPYTQDIRRAANLPLYRPPYLFRHMSPGTWYRRSPGPVHPVLNHPRRPYPDNRNGRR